jgi:hypothetical protein
MSVKGNEDAENALVTFDVSSDSTSADTSFSISSMEHLAITRAILPQGDYTLEAYLDTDNAVSDDLDINFTAGKRYYVVANGELDNLIVNIIEFDPLAPRSK